MNKIIMCLVFISCSSLFSMDSDVTLKLLDDDGNVQAERQMPLHVLKRRSNTIKEMFGDISASEVCIPTSEIPVKTWDEIESLWTLLDSKTLDVSIVEVRDKLATKSLHKQVKILNSLEYLHEPDGDSVSSVAITALVMQIQEDLRKGHEPVLQQLKPCTSRLVVDSILLKFLDSEVIDLSDRDVTQFPPDQRPFKMVPFRFIAPEYATIPQAIVLWKVMNSLRLQKFKVSDDASINESKIFESLDDVTKRKVTKYYPARHEHGCCTIL